MNEKKKKDLDQAYKKYLLELLSKIQNGSISVVMQDGVVLNIISRET